VHPCGLPSELYLNKTPASACMLQPRIIGSWPHHAAQRTFCTKAAAAAAPRHPARTLTATAATASPANITAAAADSATPCAGRAVVVGGGPAGLAAAIGLARQAGFRVDVFDARQNPANDSHSSKEALLVALGGFKFV
jgi:threonine dehydrogenase-like Zn-dependent dehydrogenase